MFIFLYFTVHNDHGPSITLFGIMRGIDGTPIFSSRRRPHCLVREVLQNAMPSSRAGMSEPSNWSYRRPFLREKIGQSSGSLIFCSKMQHRTWISSFSLGKGSGSIL